MSWHWCNWINFGYYITESDCLKLTGKAARLIPKNTLHNNDANWFGSPNYVKFSGILFVRFSIDISVLFLKIGKETFIIQREIKGWVGFFLKFCLTNAGNFTAYRSFESHIRSEWFYAIWQIENTLVDLFWCKNLVETRFQCGHNLEKWLQTDVCDCSCPRKIYCIIVYLIRNDVSTISCLISDIMII